MAGLGTFAVIAPDVIIVGDKKLTVSRLPPNALLKVHKIIVKMFATVTYQNTVFQSHIRLMHSLNEMYPADPTTDDIELFRGHIVKFVGVWYESTKHTRNYPNFASLKAMTGAQSGNSRTVKPTIEQESSDVAGQIVQISDSGNLSLTKKCEPAAAGGPDADALLDLKMRVAALKTKLAECKEQGDYIESCDPDLDDKTVESTLAYTVDQVEKATAKVVDRP
jgi:hypothetical protein